MKLKIDQSPNRKNESDKEKENHEDSSQFMVKRATKKIFALLKEVKSKLFDVSLINNEQKNTIKRIFSEIKGQTIVKQSPKDKLHQEINQQKRG